MKTQIQEASHFFVPHSPVMGDNGRQDADNRPVISVEYVEGRCASPSEKVRLSKHLMALAHEIKSPLASICLSNAYLSAEVSDPDFLLYLKIIERSTKRINDIVVSLLEDAHECRMERVDVNALLDRMLDDFEDRIGLAGVAVEKKYLASECHIPVVRDRFTRALGNIVSNAIESLPPEGGKLKIVTEVVGGKCRITIADNGCGIPKKEREKIFRMGFTRKPSGSGIGLAVAREILDDHQAILRVRSTPGRGSSFSIDLLPWT